MEGLSNDQVLGVTLFWLMWPCKKIAISMSLIASWDAMLNRNSVQNRQMSCCGKPLVHKSPAAFSINMSLLYVIRNVFWNRLLLWNICHHNRRRASSPSLSFCYCDSALFTQFILLPCISASSTIGYPAGLCALNQIHSVEFLFWRFTKGGLRSPFTSMNSSRNQPAGDPQHTVTLFAIVSPVPDCAGLENVLFWVRTWKRIIKPRGNAQVKWLITGGGWCFFVIA